MLKTGALLPFTGTTGTLLFLAFALAFAIKVPLFPFHTWLPDAHTEAPTAGSVILAAVLLKMGTYGLMRFNFVLFPEAAANSPGCLSCSAIIGIIYGALVAMVQPDVKRLVAYSSVAHMGFVILGMFSFTEYGMQGAVYQMLNHGISTGALFLLVGFIYERRHTRAISDFGGLANVMPIYCDDLCDHHDVLDRAAVSERLRRRIPDHDRNVEIAGAAGYRRNELELYRDDACRNRCHLRGGLYALDGPARFLRQGDEPEKQGTQGP